MTVMASDVGTAEDLDLDLDMTVFEMPGDEELTPIGMSIGLSAS